MIVPSNNYQRLSPSIIRYEGEEFLEHRKYLNCVMIESDTSLLKLTIPRKDA